MSLVQNHKIIRKGIKLRGEKNYWQTLSYSRIKEVWSLKAFRLDKTTQNPSWRGIVFQ